MNIQITLALRYLFRRKLRTALTTLAVVFGVMVLFGLNSILPAMLLTLRQTMLGSAGKVDLTVTGTAGGLFSEDRVEVLRAVNGIGAASGSLRQTVMLLPRTGQPAQKPAMSKPGMPSSDPSTVVVVGVEVATAQQVRLYPVSEGRFLAPQDDLAIVVPTSLATKMDLTVGDVFTLPSSTGATGFTVVGLLTTRPLPGAEEVLMPLSAAQTLLNHTGEINTLEAIFTPDADRAGVETAVTAALGDGFKLGPLEFGNELFAALQVGGYAFAMFGVMALAMGAFIIFNTFRTVLAERRRDLGMLRTVGASRRTVVGMILVESLIQSVVGTGLGLACGYGMAVLMVLIIRPILETFLHFTLLMPIITAGNLIMSVTMGVGITLLGGLLPALSAAGVTPLEALRPPLATVYEKTARKQSIAGAILLVLAALCLLTGNAALAGVGTVLFLIALVLIAPALIQPISRVSGRALTLLFAREGQIAEGNLTRQPGRAAITASAMMIGLATVIALVGMISSVRTAFMRYLELSLGADFILMPSSFILGGGNVGASPVLATAIRAVPGIDKVTTLRLGLTTVNGAQLQIIGIDPATYPEVAGLEFSAGESKAAYAALGAERALIVNGIFSMQSGAKIGDVLTLQTPEGERDYRVVGVGLDYLNAKLATAYISQANLEQDFHQNSDLLLMADTEAGADAAVVRRTLEKMVAAYPAFSLVDWQSFRQSQEQIFTSAMSMLYFLMVMFALPALIAMVNTLAINVIERTREIGMLRAVGSTRRQIGRMIQAESLLLSAAGVAFGILGGLWLGYVLITAMNASGFVLAYAFPYAGILLAIATGLLFGVFAATIPARQAARMDIVTALRYE
ncbi:MAG: ABC transporter permease [Anaerolineae bacterium]|nr:ABC transporter permease [Anaerolineae bacterium]